MIENKSVDLGVLPDDVILMTSFDFLILPDKVRFGGVSSYYHQLTQKAIRLEGREVIRFLHDLNAGLPSAQKVQGWAIEKFKGDLSTASGIHLLKAFDDIENFTIKRLKLHNSEANLDAQKYISVVVKRIIDALNERVLIRNPVNVPGFQPFPGVIGF